MDELRQIQHLNLVAYDNLLENIENDQGQNLMADLSDAQFREEFRFTRIQAVLLIEILRPHLPSLNERNRGISLEDSILLTLQWLGTGNFLWNLRRIRNCSTTTVWRCIWAVIDGIVDPDIVNQWLQWPADEESSQRHLDYFRNEYRLPNILGVVDGTHIPIMRPANDPYEAAYVNRKQFHSFNTQIICGSNYEILHVDVSSVGSAHDARVWNESDGPRLIQESRSSLIGDSAYPCRWYLLTPYDAAMRDRLDERQQLFQRRLLAARQNVEQTIGILKSRFNILKRPARYSFSMVPRVVLACCILHNICRRHNIPLDNNNIHIENRDNDDVYNDQNIGNVVRQNYIDMFML